MCERKKTKRLSYVRRKSNHRTSAEDCVRRLPEMKYCEFCVLLIRPRLIRIRRGYTVSATTGSSVTVVVFGVRRIKLRRRLLHAYLPGTGATVINSGGAPRTRPFHCTSVGLNPAITPNVGNSGTQFICVGSAFALTPVYYRLYI